VTGQPARMIVAQIVIINYPHQIKEGYTPMVDIHTSHVPCRFEKILAKVDKKGDTLEKRPSSIKQGQSAVVEMYPINYLVVEEFDEFPPMGRFVLRDGSKIVGFGVIKAVDTGDHLTTREIRKLARTRKKKEAAEYG